MPKPRIHQIAKALGVQSREVITVASGLGISVTSHQNAVTKTEEEKIKSAFADSAAVNNKSAKPPEEEQKEIVRVIESESGHVEVERRSGAGVVVRRRKKKKEELPVEEKKEIVEPEEVSKDESPHTLPNEADVPPPVEEADELRPEKRLETDEAETEENVSESAAELPEEKEIFPPEFVESRDAASEATNDGEERKPKKKAKKSRVAKEEIHDEETLEQLKKAFRTKVPSRKEYVIQNRKPKLKQNFDGPRKSKAEAMASDLEIVYPTGARPAKRNIKIGETVVVSELAKMMSVKASEVARKLMTIGAGAAINQSIDSDAASLVADEFGFDVTVERFVEDDLLFEKDESGEKNVLPRPPVVTVMGHVDHGKTTLLDSIRKTDVVAGEAGGITQHIGAYSVRVKDSTIVFVDTPGHEAFTSMRARGASITDIVILVVAADDGVMPQTVEAVDHARAAEVPIIVAINKIDKEGADPERLRRELSEIGLVSEQWGGDTLFAEISAKKKKGIAELLELVLLQADVLELGAATEKRANGVIVESELDKGRGAVSTVIVKEGTLRVGDCIVSGVYSGKVKALTDDKGKRMKSVGPSLPANVMGLSGVAEAGEKFYVVEDDKTAKEIVSRRQSKIRSRMVVPAQKLSLEDLFSSIESEEAKELPLVIKADTQGSVGAVRDSLEKLSTDRCRVKVVHAGAGGINESDVVLASASNAVVVGFNVRPDANALKVAEKEGVSLELHSIIYDVENRVKNAMEGLLEPVLSEVVEGHLDVRELFFVSRIGTIAGCMVSDGKVRRDNGIRVVRDGTVVFDGNISSLRRFKDDVKEVASGYECGVTIENFNDIKQGDILELYSVKEIKQGL